ncbi:MAG: hypothetical protein NTZ12_00530 [Candidatus Aminicenantes bacterium]|nr:hypothetical protein [Candidatus Aminicenantes bacterium]
MDYEAGGGNAAADQKTRHPRFHLGRKYVMLGTAIVKDKYRLLYLITTFGLFFMILFIRAAKLEFGMFYATLG